MPIATLAVSALCAAGVAGLSMQAVREHKSALRQRAALLDPVRPLFPGAVVRLAPDGFPALSAALPRGGSVEIGIIADTLVTRRLPQLWLKLTLRAPVAAAAADEATAPTIGVLARPTGAEFYAVTPSLPIRHDPPFAADAPMMVRARNAAPADLDRAAGALGALFADRAVKEAVIAPRAVRIVRQIAEGDRGAHMVFRQIRFPVDGVPADLVRRTLADAVTLEVAFAGDTEFPLQAAS